MLLQQARIRVSGTTTTVLKSGLKTNSARALHLLRDRRPTIRPVLASKILITQLNPVISVLSSKRLVHSASNSLLSDQGLLLKTYLDMPEKKPFERLPKTVSPSHYDLFLKPDLKAFTFDGKVKINIQVNTATDQIVLNALDLTLGKVELVLEEADGERTLKPTGVELAPDEETLTLSFAETLQLGPATLSISFTGELNDKMKGFYRSKYMTAEGERYTAVTQFEATDARRCFPCWDEPAIKAPFNITLAVPQHKVALSNMPVLSDTDEGEGLRVLRFDTTPTMPTYLVAVVVGEFDYIEDRSEDGVLVRVYTPVGKGEQGRFALHVATRVLPYYKQYFQIAYPLPKIDLIAIADFSAGAMENWGLVTYRESCLLVDRTNSSAVQKQWIALIVGHELAHQWFGNLVTMEWWTHLWLNEGYASFVEFLCVHHLFPEYDIWTQFVTNTYNRALELDCLNNSHPIEVPVGHPSEIDEIFDDISYNKGASIIRMLHEYIGDEDFRKGMHIYLTRHQYGNTSTEDLWAALEEASSKPVGQVMSSWTKQMGFPMITVEDSVQEDTSRTLTLSQTKFCADPNSTDETSLWHVPLAFSKASCPGETCHREVLRTRRTKVRLEGVAPADWVKVNPGTVGYYRTRYATHILQQFIPAIRDKAMPPLDRLGLVDNLFALVQAGKSPTVEVLQLMEAMTQEDNYTVWSSISNCLSKLSVLLSNTDFEDDFKAYGRRLMADIGQRLGWKAEPNESHLDTLLRSLVLSNLAWFRDPAVIAEARTRFDAHFTGSGPIPADIRSPVYKAVLYAGDMETYMTMLKLYRETDLQEERDRICRSLGGIENETILQQVLKFAMSDEVRSQDAVFVIISVGQTKLGRELAWSFLKENWEVLMDRYQSGFLLSRLVKHTTENFASEERAVDVNKFFREHVSPGVERTVQQSCESIRLNAAWLARDRLAIQMYLRECAAGSAP